MSKLSILFTCLFIPFITLSQESKVPADHVMNNDELFESLDLNYPPLNSIHDLYLKGDKQKAIKQLTDYFKARFSERYFFSWKNFNQKFTEYNQMYSGRENYHKKNANQHLELYPAYVQWVMPFKNLKGENVQAYPYRHLTRQEKAKDIALSYYYSNDTSYLNYIPEQARSLNEAFNRGKVETIENGNGAYEALHAGKRMFNWLFDHQIFLASNQYTSDQQLEMIRTFLHTAAQIESHNQKYSEGNHQTLGVSALAQIAILFPEIKGSKTWLKTATQRLEEHLTKEIYPDGFQFERSIHYHIADIENYFYPWQLAKINKIDLGSIWESRIKGMFEVLVQMATPDQTLPVLQDDTDSPWSEYNEMGEIMALGTAVYNDPSWSYFASSKLSSSDYWILTDQQIKDFKNSKKQKPTIGSTQLPHTSYYIMREGWNDEDKYMIISAGLTPEKPDHQHGDMLGIQAYAYGNYILPNYQVRYSLNDLEYFKNSWVKNVCIADSIPQGQGWNMNSSGFGKWNNLPQPKVITWYKSDSFDYFCGQHEGYKNQEIEYYRQVFFLKNDFWIVKDQFISNKPHKYQQIWQGHYSIEEINKHIRSVFSNGAGLEIIQLNDSVNRIYQNSRRGKGMTIFEKHGNNGQSFTTLLYPFENFDECLLKSKISKIKDWNIKYNLNLSKELSKNFSCDAKTVIYNNKKFLLLSTSKLKIKNTEIEIQTGGADLWMISDDQNFNLLNADIKEIKVRIDGTLKNIKSGDEIPLLLK